MDKSPILRAAPAIIGAGILTGAFVSGYCAALGSAWGILGAVSGVAFLFVALATAEALRKHSAKRRSYLNRASREARRNKPFQPRIYGRDRND